MITVAVEGDTDVPFFTRLCEESGFTAHAPLIATNGKDAMQRYITSFAKAGSRSPYLVVRDLDQDAPCARAWLEREAPQNPGKYFALRLAVRAVEAWFLSDAHHAARCLPVKTTRIPSQPDDEPDPKVTIVKIARLSTKPAVRDAIVPPPRSFRKAGPGYTGWLLDAAQGWSFHDAVTRSPSLARAHERLKQMREAWHGEGR